MQMYELEAMTLDNFALFKVCQLFCENQKSNNLSSGAIYKSLLRCGITSIEELINADEQEIRLHRTIGKERLAIITYIKSVLEEHWGA